MVLFNFYLRNMYTMELSLFGMKLRLELIILCIVVGMILGGHLLCSCSKISMLEGMEVMGSAVNKVAGDDVYNSWVNKADKYASKMGYTTADSRYEMYKGTPVPLPEGEMNMFADNEFKPECCPSTYSSSSGCACITQEQVDYLNERGGNRTLAPAEY